MDRPKITVLMPVHNAEEHLREAIESILAQSFTAFEFLIIDDGSRDRSREIVQSVNDPRIVHVENPENRGTVHVLNQGIALAKGTYIARMDADDFSLPDRLQRQFDFMENHPEIGVSGTAMRLIKRGKLKNTRTQPATDEELKIQLLFSTCFFHPTVIIRTELAKAHPYPDNLVYTQDYNYWCRLAGKTRFANLPETMLHFREHEGQTSTRKADLQITNARQIRKTYLEELFGPRTPEQLNIHHQLAENRRDIDLQQALQWLEKLIALNKKHKIFKETRFERETARKWWLACRKNSKHGRTALSIYRSTPLHRLYRPTPGKYLKFCIKCATNTRS